MPTSDQTQTAVLGALSIAPMTGYAVREEIRSTLGHFWAESFGQIYPALAELQRQGMVERQGVGDSPRASKFAITARGAARLSELLVEPPQQAKPRNGLLLRLFFGRQLGPEACRDLVIGARAEAEAHLASLGDIREELQSDAGEDAAYILLTVLAGEHSARATVAWAEDALAELDGIPLRGKGSPESATSTKEHS